jgi:2'-5' RNA ligase
VTTADAARPWRCFVAVPLPVELRRELAAWVARLRNDAALAAAWRWSDAEGWHLTLAFLGATPPDAVPGITERLAGDIAELDGFSVTAGGIGGFAGRSRARVLWYGVHDNERRLAGLARVVRAATGVDEGDAFRPHVTLARARDRRGAPLPSLPVEGLPAGEIPIASMSLMRSHLGRGPAHYETLAEIPLRAPVAARTPA